MRRKELWFARALVALCALPFVFAETASAQEVTCTPTGFYQDGVDLTAAVIATSDVTNETIDATGCNIGIFYGPNTLGTVYNVTVSGANYFGILVAGDIVDSSGNAVSPGTTSVDITASTVENIGDSPFDGAQHGVGIYYHAFASGSSATGTVSGNTVSQYQKGGIVVNGAGSSVSVSDNAVTGLGPVHIIAQNGIQFGFGARVDELSGNEVSGNIFTQISSCAPSGVFSCVGVVSTGILLYAAENSLGEPETNLDQGSIASSNHAFDNQSDVTIVQ